MKKEINSLDAFCHGKYIKKYSCAVCALQQHIVLRYIYLSHSVIFLFPFLFFSFLLFSCCIFSFASIHFYTSRLFISLHALLLPDEEGKKAIYTAPRIISYPYFTFLIALYWPNWLFLFSLFLLPPMHICIYLSQKWYDGCCLFIFRYIGWPMFFRDLILRFRWFRWMWFHSKYHILF